jgi:hypothetical protein
MSNTKISNGRKSLSSKPRGAPAVSGPPDFMANKLSVPKHIAEAITASGNEFRWINYKKFVNDGAIHENGWIPYKADKAQLDSASSLMFGSNPDGIIRRGDCLLAIRSKDFCDQHRAWIKQKTADQSNIQEDKANEFRARAKGTGITVDEGFEEDSQ